MIDAMDSHQVCTSLQQPAKQKAAWQNQRLESAPVSNTIVEYFSLPMYAPWSVMG